MCFPDKLLSFIETDYEDGEKLLKKELKQYLKWEKTEILSSAMEVTK